MNCQLAFRPLQVNGAVNDEDFSAPPHLALVAVPEDLLIGAVGDPALVVLPTVDAVAEGDIGPGVDRRHGDGPPFEALHPAAGVDDLELLADGAVQDGVALEDPAPHALDLDQLA